MCAKVEILGTLCRYEEMRVGLSHRRRQGNEAVGVGRSAHPVTDVESPQGKTRPLRTLHIASPIPLSLLLKRQRSPLNFKIACFGILCLAWVVIINISLSDRLVASRPKSLGDLMNLPILIHLKPKVDRQGTLELLRSPTSPDYGGLKLFADLRHSSKDHLHHDNRRRNENAQFARVIDPEDVDRYNRERGIQLYRMDIMYVSRRFDHDQELRYPRTCVRNNWRSRIYPNCNTVHELHHERGRQKILG